MSLKEILSNLCLGNDVSINGQIINDDNRKMFHDVFINLYTVHIIKIKKNKLKALKSLKKRVLSKEESQ